MKSQSHVEPDQACSELRFQRGAEMDKVQNPKQLYVIYLVKIRKIVNFCQCLKKLVVFCCAAGKKLLFAKFLALLPQIEVFTQNIFRRLWRRVQGAFVADCHVTPKRHICDEIAVI